MIGWLEERKIKQDQLVILRGIRGRETKKREVCENLSLIRREVTFISD